MITGQRCSKTRFIDYALEHLEKLRNLLSSPPPNTADHSEEQSWKTAVHDESVRCAIFSAVAVEAETMVLFRLRGESSLQGKKRGLFRKLFYQLDGGQWCRWTEHKLPLLEAILQEVELAYPQADLKTVTGFRNRLIHFTGEAPQSRGNRWLMELIRPEPNRDNQAARQAYMAASKILDTLAQAHERLDRMKPEEVHRVFWTVTKNETKRRAEKKARTSR